ncbi:phage tail protein [Leptolyngbya sp. AN03gr2]|uniref:phage tail protein n=1 Tax=unclassified Leptolyngbya TaxID=2650499 RepID=UPI003D31FCE7
MASVVRRDPYGVYNFYVEWDGIIHAGFQSCSGLKSSQEAGTYREGTDPLTQRKIPGLVSYDNITLKRGITSNDELWKWRTQLASGNANRRNLSIVVMDDTGVEKIRWNLINCWPISWSADEFNAESDAFAIETLELAHEGVTIDKWS